jgi:hypothetical protein
LEEEALLVVRNAMLLHKIVDFTALVIVMAPVFIQRENGCVPVILQLAA